MISYYTDDNTCEEKHTVTLDFEGSADTYEMFLLDSTHDAESIGKVTAGTQIELAPNTVCLLKSL